MLRQQERLMPTLAGMLFCILILRKPNRNIPPYRRHDSAASPASVPAFRFDINSRRPFSFSASLAKCFKALINCIPSCTQKSRVIDQSLPVAWRGRDDTVLQRQINLQPAVAPLVTSICHEPWKVEVIQIFTTKTPLIYEPFHASDRFHAILRRWNPPITKSTVLFRKKFRYVDWLINMKISSIQVSFMSLWIRLGHGFDESLLITTNHYTSFFQHLTLQAWDNFFHGLHMRKWEEFPLLPCLFPEATLGQDGNLFWEARLTGGNFLTAYEIELQPYSSRQWSPTENAIDLYRTPRTGLPLLSYIRDVRAALLHRKLPGFHFLFSSWEGLGRLENDKYSCSTKLVRALW